MIRKVHCFGMALVLTALCGQSFLFGQSKATDNSKDVELIGVAQIPGDAIDKTGLNEVLIDDIRHDRLDGFSAIAQAKRKQQFIAVSDRGPKDGAVDYACRFHTFKILIHPNRKKPVNIELVGTTLFKRKDGSTYSGLSLKHEDNQRFDPEGIRLLENGNLVVSDEYGPHVVEFDFKKGREVKKHPVDKKFLIAKPGQTKAEENKNNTSGRQGNRGMEGLAVTPLGNVYGLMQSPLIQDCERTEEGKLKGLNCRMVGLSETKKEFVYQLDDKSNKLNEILAVDENVFLVIERDGKVGSESSYKKINVISIDGATDVQNINALPAKKLSDDVKPVAIKPVVKRCLIDLLDSRWGLHAQMPEKIEGLCFGPRLANGRRTLLVLSDNDFEKQASQLFVFAVPENLLTVSVVDTSKKGLAK